MIFRNYNDFEVINLVKEGNEEAFDFMVDKYRYLIAKKIKNFNLLNDYDDCYQEALMLLHKSIIKFDESYNRTFTRFFEANLHNFLITYKGKKSRYTSFMIEKLPIICDFVIKETEKIYFLDQEIYRALNTLSELEKKVYQSKIIEKRSVRECAKYLNCDEKQVYNALDRIRKKIKLHLMA
ncbi:MAG: sigma-70 family RNA polymerase sigma factor [Candidatus Izemoplasmatales bacterium]|nr:sigma-70 family RNA polymerase sigma factor [Candidatus Izemoplasmatales bacterium]